MATAQTREPDIPAASKTSILDLPNELLHNIILLSPSLDSFLSLSLVNRHFNLLTAYAGKEFSNILIPNVLDRKTDRAGVVEIIFILLRSACDKLIHFKREGPGVYVEPWDLLHECFHIGDWMCWWGLPDEHERELSVLGSLFETREKELTITVMQWLDRNKPECTEKVHAWAGLYYRQRLEKWGFPEFGRFGIEDAFLVNKLFTACSKVGVEGGNDIPKRVELKVEADTWGYASYLKGSYTSQRVRERLGVNQEE
ncbi:hypothetical protein BJ508DRAFT_308563 [Ascobolus immersus RN42]|uniref:F-box domain-containing protein n=1 Tax=Ascobolus immersus RN42 TaxID=1160509 RepID=A0A3N4I381_ASCIM|nr:hypothetical protein BJ508DRAFT_308563 [Ascobolus immersus RN42]